MKAECILRRREGSSLPVSSVCEYCVGPTDIVLLRNPVRLVRVSLDMLVDILWSLLLT